MACMVGVSAPDYFWFLAGSLFTFLIAAIFHLLQNIGLNREAKSIRVLLKLSLEQMENKGLAELRRDADGEIIGDNINIKMQ